VESRPGDEKPRQGDIRSARSLWSRLALPLPVIPTPALHLHLSAPSARPSSVALTPRESRSCGGR
jgi:hypothetical protein